MQHTLQLIRGGEWMRLISTGQNYTLHTARQGITSASGVVMWHFQRFNYEPRPWWWSETNHRVLLACYLRVLGLSGVGGIEDYEEHTRLEVLRVLKAGFGTEDGKGEDLDVQGLLDIFVA